MGAALAAVALLVALTALVVEKGDGVVLQAAVGICVALLPLATGAAILRYRPYDLDRRTLAYGLLTVLLGVGYAVVVLGLGRLLPQGSSQVVAGATLTVAALFDLDTLTGELLAVVHQTIQPTQASLWLRPHSPSSTAGAVAVQQRPSAT